MPPLYGAGFLWIAASVLWWSGWREESEDRLPDRAAAVFLAGWPLTAWWSRQVEPGVTINGAFAWAGIAMLVLLWRLSSGRRWTAVAAGMMIGCLFVLLEKWPAFERNGFDPSEPWPLALLGGVLLGFLLRTASEQIVALTAALILAEGFAALPLRESGYAIIGNAEWMERWWIALLSARLWSWLAAAFVRWFWNPSWNKDGGRTS
ncbi:hypothetical protein ACFPVX_01115 [Cohnella faecalis]|uniref:Uncharacterized protein n=1 Tax=Cohnella faecalis TaxID=2315694 RepID=A0A398CMN6_9BACL|nr:hypothetical protein [Cohnella faecalis]RIE04626.1 hypothetical protein D3H35_03800 [Cohnella faecalis]